jgi:hypothetical protein
VVLHLAGTGGASRDVSRRIEQAGLIVQEFHDAYHVLSALVRRRREALALIADLGRLAGDEFELLHLAARFIRPDAVCCYGEHLSTDPGGPALPGGMHRLPAGDHAAERIDEFVRRLKGDRPRKPAPTPAETTTTTEAPAGASPPGDGPPAAETPRRDVGQHDELRGEESWDALLELPGAEAIDRDRSAVGDAAPDEQGIGRTPVPWAPAADLPARTPPRAGDLPRRPPPPILDPDHPLLTPAELEALLGEGEAPRD